MTSLKQLFASIPTVHSQFTTLLNKSGFGDVSGNTLIMIEDEDTTGSQIVMIILMIIAIMIFVFGFKSISVLCPGNWMATHWILLFLLITTGGNIGIVYIIMAYMLKMKIC
jgi:hypothetical protein